MHCILVRCYLPKSVGRCRASTPKYYYNAENQACEQFNYGGCLGNANKFDTTEECEQQCVLTQTAGSLSRIFFLHENEYEFPSRGNVCNSTKMSYTIEGQE